MNVNGSALKTIWLINILCVFYIAHQSLLFITKIFIDTSFTSVLDLILFYGHITLHQ